MAREAPRKPETRFREPFGAPRVRRLSRGEAPLGLSRTAGEDFSFLVAVTPSPAPAFPRGTLFRDMTCPDRTSPTALKTSLFGTSRHGRRDFQTIDAIFGPFWGPQGTGSGPFTDFAVILAQGSASLRFGTASVALAASKNMFGVRFRSIWEKRFRKKVSTGSIRIYNAAKTVFRF